MWLSGEDVAVWERAGFLEQMWLSGENCLLRETGNVNDVLVRKYSESSSFAEIIRETK